MSANLSTQFARLGQRVDSLSLRERVILFASTAVVMLALLDQTVLSPTLKEQRERSARLVKQGTELGQLRSQVNALALEQPQGNTEEDRLLAAVRAAQSEQQALARQLAASRSESAQPVRLPELLARVLQRHEGLTLVQLASRAPAAEASASASTLVWQRAELSVAGSYADLSRFVAELERNLPGLRWGELQLSTEASPPVMTLHVWLQGGVP
jgi:MSHA biogenesis protein MshJ